MSNAGKTKLVNCIECGDTITVSLYASSKTAKCDTCKKMDKKVERRVGARRTIQDHSVDRLLEDIAGDKPVKIELIRNRQEIEGRVIMDTGEIMDRVPAEWLVQPNKLDYLSVSKIKTYMQCPAKFKKQYMAEDTNSEKDNGNIFTWFGTILHEVAQFAEQLYHENGIVANPLSLYDDAWRRQPLTDLAMYKEGKDLIIDYFGRNPVGSGKFKPLMIDGKATIEYEWRGPLGDIPEFGCMFDYIGELDSETGIIMDYKTNRQPFTPYDLENDLQLLIYEIIARKEFPQYKKWVSGFELFRFGWQQCPPRSDEDLQDALNFINNIYHQIRNDNSWEERLNVFCGYCNKKSECQEYCDFVNNPKRGIETIVTDMTNLEEIERDREMIGAMEKIIKDRKDELANITKATIEQSVKEGKSVVVDGQELYLHAQNRKSYDYYGAKQIMAVHGKLNELDSCLTINKTKMDKLVNSNPALALELQKCLRDGYTAPYIMKKKYNPKKK